MVITREAIRLQTSEEPHGLHGNLSKRRESMAPRSRRFTVAESDAASANPAEPKFHTAKTLLREAMKRASPGASALTVISPIKIRLKQIFAKKAMTPAYAGVRVSCNA
jgi:hypothetical protein